MLLLLDEINHIKPVFIELGLQTIHTETAQYINSCFSLDEFDNAVARLQKIGVHIIVHLILGLPGETEEDMLESVKYVASSGVNGIKLQMLHVLKGARLEKDYLTGNVPLMSLDEYKALVAKCISLLPEDMVVHRITGDPDKKLLVAPEWCADKKKALNAINKSIRAFK